MADIDSELLMQYNQLSNKIASFEKENIFRDDERSITTASIALLYILLNNFNVFCSKLMFILIFLEGTSFSNFFCPTETQRYRQLLPLIGQLKSISQVNPAFFLCVSCS